MKKQILTILITTLLIISCSNNDDSENKTNCEGNVSLVTSNWKGNGDRSGDRITFVSKANYSWIADWGTREGTY